MHSSLIMITIISTLSTSNNILAGLCNRSVYVLRLTCAAVCLKQFCQIIKNCPSELFVSSKFLLNLGNIFQKCLINACGPSDS